MIAYANRNILTLVTFLPFLGALLLLLFPRRDRDIRWFALLISTLTFLASLHLPWHYSYAQAGFQYEQNVPWITTPNIHYHLGVDGISLWLVRKRWFAVARTSRPEARRSRKTGFTPVVKTWVRWRRT